MALHMVAKATNGSLIALNLTRVRGVSLGQRAKAKEAKGSCPNSFSGGTTPTWIYMDEDFASTFRSGSVLMLQTVVNAPGAGTCAVVEAVSPLMPRKIMTAAKRNDKKTASAPLQKLVRLLKIAW